MILHMWREYRRKKYLQQQAKLFEDGFGFAAYEIMWEGKTQEELEAHWLYPVENKRTEFDRGITEFCRLYEENKR